MGTEQQGFIIKLYVGMCLRVLAAHVCASD